MLLLARAAIPERIEAATVDHGLRPEAVEYNEAAAVLQHVWIASRRSLRDVLESVTVRQLADGKLPRSVSSRTSDEDAWQPH